MGKVVVTVEGKYYIVDDEGDVKRVIVQDDPTLSLDEMKKILKFFATKSKD